MYNNSEWVDLYVNLRKTHSRWGMMENVLGRTGEAIKSCTVMYLAVVQAMILCGREIWVGVDPMITVLYLFHNKIDRRIEGVTARKGGSREWWWSMVDVALETTSL